jgi:RNA polymerase sigma-70 factor, ECF subfamily
LSRVHGSERGVDTAAARGSAAASPHAQPSDAELVQRAQADRAAFGALYERYVDRIYSYLLYRTAERADAEDLTARVFFQALQRLSGFEERGLPFAAWLFTIAHNLVANYHRDRSRRPTAPLEAAGHPAAPAPFASPEEIATVRQAVGELSDERQHLILLKYAQGMSNAEIGRAMNRSEGAIKSLLRRTLDQLRRNIDADTAEEDGR